MSNKHTIKLENFSDIFEEYAAAATVTPGDLLMLTSAGKVQRHNAAGQNVLPRFAVEDELQGKGIDDNYASGNQVNTWIPQRGDVVNVTLEDGETVVIGDYAESAGNGHVQKHVPDTESIGGDSSGGINTFYTNQIIGQFEEAKDLSGSSGEESSGIQGDQRVALRIL